MGHEPPIALSSLRLASILQEVIGDGPASTVVVRVADFRILVGLPAVSPLDARWNGRFARSSDALRGCSAVPSWELLQPETLDAVVCPDAEDMMGLPWLRAECVRRGIPCPPILVHTAARAQAAVLLRSRVAWSQAETRRMLPSDGPGGAEPAAMGKDNVWNDAWSRMLDSEHDEGGGGVVEDGSGWELELDRRIAPPAASTEGIQWVPAPSWSQTQALLSHAVPTAFGQPWRLESDSRAWLAAGVDIPGGLMQCFIRSDFASRAPPGPTIVHTSLPRADAPRSEAPQPVVPALWMVALPAGGTGGASAFLGSDGKHQFLILGRWLGRSRRLRPGRVGSGHGVSMLDSDAVRGCRDWFVAGEALQLQHVSPSAPSAPGATEGENVEPLTGQPDDAIRSRAVIRPSGMVAENESPDAGSTWVRQFERFIDAIGKAMAQSRSIWVPLDPTDKGVAWLRRLVALVFSRSAEAPAMEHRYKQRVRGQLRRARLAACGDPEKPTRRRKAGDGEESDEGNAAAGEEGGPSMDSDAEEADAMAQDAGELPDTGDASLHGRSGLLVGDIWGESTLMRCVNRLVRANRDEPNRWLWNTSCLGPLEEAWRRMPRIIWWEPAAELALEVDLLSHDGLPDHVQRTADVLPRDVSPLHRWVEAGVVEVRTSVEARPEDLRELPRGTIVVGGGADCGTGPSSLWRAMSAAQRQALADEWAVVAPGGTTRPWGNGPGPSWTSSPVDDRPDARAWERLLRGAGPTRHLHLPIRGELGASPLERTVAAYWASDVASTRRKADTDGKGRRRDRSAVVVPEVDEWEQIPAREGKRGAASHISASRGRWWMRRSDVGGGEVEEGIRRLDRAPRWAKEMLNE